MYPGWLVGIALVIAIWCIGIFVYRVVTLMKQNDGQIVPNRSMLFVVKNQEDIIEGLIRRVCAEACTKPVEVITLDAGSTDKTRVILKRLAEKSKTFKFVPSSEVHISKKIRNLCRGNIVYCFDLTSSINYSLMVKTIDSILLNSQVTSLYRTRVLTRNNTMGH